jgi:hypothetical protein
MYKGVSSKLHQFLISKLQGGIKHRAPVSGSSCSGSNAFISRSGDRLFRLRFHAVFLSASRVRYPCGGGVEYLHRDPTSRRRRWNGKSQIWESKIWSRVQRGSDQRMTALARASSNCKRQTRPLIRESAPHQQTRNCPTVIKIWS